MAEHQLDLATLKDHLSGGRVGIAFEDELKRVVQDCEDRPGDSKPRTVTLQLTIEPILDQGGFCEEVRGKVRISSSVPKPISFGVRKGGMLVFNDPSEEGVNQKTLDF